MAKADDPKKAEPPQIYLAVDSDLKGELKPLGGSHSDWWNRTIAHQVINATWLEIPDPIERQKTMTASVQALKGIAPADQMEGMLAAQMVASHNAAMECYRRAMIESQPADYRQSNLNQANKLSRTYATLLESLNRHRGKGQQKVTVEHVHVHAGGQAIVGNVEAGARGAPGGAGKTEEQHNAKQIADARQPTLSGENQADKAPLPVARD